MWRRMQRLVRSCLHASHLVTTALGEEEACCTLRQAPAVALSSGVLLPLSCCRDRPGITVTHSLVYSALPSEIAGASSSFLSVKIYKKFGEDSTAALTMFQLVPVRSSI